MMETLSRLIDILSYDPAEPMIFSSGLFLYLFLGFFYIHQCFTSIIGKS